MELDRPLYLSYRKKSTSVEAIQEVEKLIQHIDPSTAYSLIQAGEVELNDEEHRYETGKTGI